MEVVELLGEVVELLDDSSFSEQEMMVRLKQEVRKMNINIILRCVIFFTDKDIITLNNPSTPNIINHLGIIERS